jgi:hypothetical protein
LGDSGQESVHLRRLAFDNQFHVTLRSIANRAGYREARSQMLGGIAETHTLNAT